MLLYHTSSLKKKNTLCESTYMYCSVLQYIKQCLSLSLFDLGAKSILLRGKS